MIKKIKDISEVTLNKEDVMVESLVRVPKKSSIDLSALSDESKKALDKEQATIVSMKIIAKGSDVDFLVGDYISTKTNSYPLYDLLDEIEGDKETLEKRVFVIHKNTVEYSVNPSNYEL